MSLPLAGAVALRGSASESLRALLRHVVAGLCACCSHYAAASGQTTVPATATFTDVCCRASARWTTRRIAPKQAMSSRTRINCGEIPKYRGHYSRPEFACPTPRLLTRTRTSRTWSCIVVAVPRRWSGRRASARRLLRAAVEASGSRSVPSHPAGSPRRSVLPRAASRMATSSCSRFATIATYVAWSAALSGRLQSICLCRTAYLLHACRSVGISWSDAAIVSFVPPKFVHA